MDEYFTRLCAEGPAETFHLPERDEYIPIGSYFNVQWNPEIWKMLPQSMGSKNGVKRNLPKRGDLVDFVLTHSGKRHVAARGIIHSGFEEGDIHRGHPCNRANSIGERKHEENPFFCWVEILEFVEAGEKVAFVNQLTWHEY